MRGLGKTRPAAWANLWAYWVLGLPLGYWLALRTPAGIRGLWWALAAGLAVMAIILAVQATRAGRTAREACLLK